jgi:hypothetical protein
MRGITFHLPRSYWSKSITVHPTLDCGRNTPYLGHTQLSASLKSQASLGFRERQGWRMLFSDFFLFLHINWRKEDVHTCIYNKSAFFTDLLYMVLTKCGQNNRFFLKKSKEISKTKSLNSHEHVKWFSWWWEPLKSPLSSLRFESLCDLLSVSLPLVLWKICPSEKNK